MKKTRALTLTSLFILLASACVTTAPDTVEQSNTPAPAVKTENPATEAEKPDNAIENSGIVYSLRSMTDGPLLLGSKEYLTAPVAEFSLLFSTYFPLSGIDPEQSHYKQGDGTKWEVVSEQIGEKVTFERALLSTDNEGNSWWLFKVEGDGYARTYEFLADKSWHLLKMRYPSGSEVREYVPSVDENSDLSSPFSPDKTSKSEQVVLKTSLGDLSCSHISSDSAEFWISDKVTGQYVKTVLKKDGVNLLEAKLTGVADGYRTELGSY